MDIGTEELSHLEIVGCLARMHLKPLKSVREEAEADPLIAIAGSGGVNLFNSQGTDILHAEKQLLKALPKMAKSPRSAQLQNVFDIHLGETEGQVERDGDFSVGLKDADFQVIPTAWAVAAQARWQT
jgi:hypothetical protein